MSILFNMPGKYMSDENTLAYMEYRTSKFFVIFASIVNIVGASVSLYFNNDCGVLSGIFNIVYVSLTYLDYARKRDKYNKVRSRRSIMNLAFMLKNMELIGNNECENIYETIR